MDKIIIALEIGLKNTISLYDIEYDKGLISKDELSEHYDTEINEITLVLRTLQNLEDS